MVRFITLISFLFLALAAEAQQISAWEITWNYQGVKYEALLWMPSNSDDFAARVKYYANGCNVIEQDFSTTIYPDFTLMEGYNPRFIYRSRYNENGYKSDNLIFDDESFFMLYDLEHLLYPGLWSKTSTPRRIYTLKEFERLRYGKYTCR